MLVDFLLRSIRHSVPYAEMEAARISHPSSIDNNYKSAKESTRNGVTKSKFVYIFDT